MLIWPRQAKDSGSRKEGVLGVGLALTLFLFGARARVCVVLGCASRVEQETTRKEVMKNLAMMQGLMMKTVTNIYDVAAYCARFLFSVFKTQKR